MRRNKLRVVFGVRRPVAALKALTDQRTPKLIATASAIARPRANRDVLPRCLHLNFAIRSIVISITWVIAEQVLGPQFISDRREGLRQETDCFRALNLAARPVRDFH